MLDLPTDRRWPQTELRTETMEHSPTPPSFGLRRKPVSAPAAQAGRAALYALWLRQQHINTEDAADLVMARYPHTRSILTRHPA
jgi:hypothetical protein